MIKQAFPDYSNWEEAYNSSIPFTHYGQFKNSPKYNACIGTDNK